jgi:hypothetical protein
MNKGRTNISQIARTGTGTGTGTDSWNNALCIMFISPANISQLARTGTGIGRWNSALCVMFIVLYPQTLGDESGQLMVDGPSGSRNSDGVADVLCELEEFT